MHQMLPKLRLDMTTTDLDMTIAKIMRERNYKDEIFVDPKQFAKNLAWHPKPGTAPGLRRALDQAKEKRAQVAHCERRSCLFQHIVHSHLLLRAYVIRLRVET
jgi:predicted alternative tryptophan synthase beta-subunit